MTETTAPDTTQFYQEPTHDEIALSAFLLWESEGRPSGCEMEYWLRAESQLRATRMKKAEAAAAQAALPWPRTGRTTGPKKAVASASSPLETTMKRTTAPKSARRPARA